MPTWQSAATLVHKIAENFHLPYYTISPTYSVCQNHGYISGEHFICPDCGKEAEVYSRITGYYRPVKNWNAGKTQEFAYRKEYVPEHFGLKPITPCKEEGFWSTGNSPEKEVLLFTTPTCPNCSTAKQLLDDSGISYKIINAVENKAVALKHKVMQAPSVVVVSGDDAEKHLGIDQVRAFIENCRLN